MNSNKNYDVQNDILSINFNYQRGDLLQATSVIYRLGVERAEKILAKFIVRRFLAMHNIDEISNSLDINKIIANSLKIYTKFE